MPITPPPAGNEDTILHPPATATVIPISGSRTRHCPTCGVDFPADFVVCPRDATPLTGAGEDPLVGSVLAGTYRITRVLAEGGMGRVYEAEHTRLLRPLAVKALHVLYATSINGVARFEREARAAGLIRSENVVAVIDVLRTPEGRPCVVYERLEGEDLQARLDRVGKMCPTEALPIVRQVCRGLAAAHAQGVVHRDLKPSNIFLTRGGGGDAIAKIVDFGVAKLVDDDEHLTQTGAVLGTPSYMAPEQARGSHDADARSDVYAAGAVLYRMLTGRAPFETTKSTTNVLVRILDEQPPRARSIEPGIPEGIEAVIEHAMARDPAARLASATELEARLAAFDAATPPASIAPEHDPTHITRRARAARPKAAALVAGTALAAGLATASLLDATVKALGRAVTASRSEWMLILALAFCAAAAVAASLARVFGRRWRNEPEVSELTRRVGRALAWGVGTFGVLDLTMRGVLALSHGPGAQSPAGTAVRLVAGVAVTVALLVLRRPANGHRA